MTPFSLVKSGYDEEMLHLVTEQNKVFLWASIDREFLFEINSELFTLLSKPGVTRANCVIVETSRFNELVEAAESMSRLVAEDESRYEAWVSEADRLEDALVAIK